MTTLHVSIESQTVELREDGETILSLPVSTSRFGLGTEEGSNRTPLGRFAVCEKHGEDAEWGTIFKSREPVGLWESNEETSEDLVLSRILRLAGLDEDNLNTYQRYIYFHGTNQEHLIGTPSSHGCIRLTNSDMITLFDLVPVGTEVQISIS